MVGKLFPKLTRDYPLFHLIIIIKKNLLRKSDLKSPHHVLKKEHQSDYPKTVLAMAPFKIGGEMLKEVW